MDHGVDMQQFWAQMYEAWAAGEQWWLTEEEEQMRDEAADRFQTLDPVAEAVLESLDRRSKDPAKYCIQVIVGPQHMLALCDNKEYTKKNTDSATAAMKSVLGKGRDLHKRGSPTKQERWVVTATKYEMDTHKLYMYKPQVSHE